MTALILTSLVGMYINGEGVQVCREDAQLHIVVKTMSLKESKGCTLAAIRTCVRLTTEEA